MFATQDIQQKEIILEILYEPKKSLIWHFNGIIYVLLM